jgi:hypothetical protein
MYQRTKLSQASSFPAEAVAKAQLGRYVRTNLFPVCKSLFLDEDFKINKLAFKHYLKLCSALVGHTLTGAGKTEYMIKLWGMYVQFGLN